MASRRIFVYPHNCKSSTAFVFRLKPEWKLEDFFESLEKEGHGTFDSLEISVPSSATVRVKVTDLSHLRFVKLDFALNKFRDNDLVYIKNVERTNNVKALTESVASMREELKTLAIDDSARGSNLLWENGESLVPPYEDWFILLIS